MISTSFNFTKDTIDDKMKNPLWKGFIISWITWNWEVWYITFFESAESLGKSKIDYINNMYTYFEFYNLFPFLGYIFNWTLIPLFFSYILIFWVEEKLSPAFKEQSLRIKEADMKLRNYHLEKINRKLAKQLELEKKQSEIKGNIGKDWENELTQLDEKYEDWGKELNRLIYESNGITKMGYMDPDGHPMPEYSNPKYLGAFKAYDLVELIDESSLKYELTQKGNIFLKKWNPKK